jgi:acetoin utilization deacetylase AcuC-like enzyme
VAVGDAIAPFRSRLTAISPRPADEPELLRVHEPALLSEIEAAAARAPMQLDPDTYLGPGSREVALLAAGGTVELARAVARGDVAAGLAAVRPPGHHAESDRAMGFCVFNNVAVAARALQAEEGVERVLILDWDVHHGNGTQHSFESDPDILYFSTHQYPYYPGTGDFGEVGLGRGAGATVNVPLPAGSGDEVYLGVFQRVFVPVARAFRPDVLLVSAGFDAHRDDPLAAMEVSADGWAALAALVRAVADEVCGGRLVFVLEGGYALSGLRDGIDATLSALVAEAPPVLAGPVDAPAGSLLGRLVDRVVGIHGAGFPDLGAA